jgi:Mce-associated membrane protein
VIAAPPHADTYTRQRRIAQVTSEVQAPPLEEDAAVQADGSLPADAAMPDGAGDGPARARLTLPVVPLLAVLLVLLLAGAGYLWGTRPAESAVRTDDYVGALQAARSGIVDYTSFDYLTLDDDIEQIRRIAIGDLRDEGVAMLDKRRQDITTSQAVLNTEVVGAGVTRADDSDATVLLVIQSTQESKVSPQAQIARYRIRVDLKKQDGRWLLSGISGT